MIGAWEGHLQNSSQLVREAELIAHPGSVEMRVELRTEDLGTMELRAIMHENRLGAAIGVGTLDAKTALATELPGLQRALMEKNVHLDSISIFSASSGGATGHESGYKSPSGNSLHAVAKIVSYPPLRWEETSPVSGGEAWHPGDRWVRLSVRA
jgi:Flagellar hook-length control protein FliK